MSSLLRKKPTFTIATLPYLSTLHPVTKKTDDA
jgi:hypothetical protein